LASIARFAAALGACWLALSAFPVAASELEALEADVLAQINYARANPRDYADRLREYRANMEGNILYLPGHENGVITREGIGAVDEAIDFMERQVPLPPLSPGQILALAARDHADAQGMDGGVGHVSHDGASPGQRVKRRGGDIYVGENISYGFDAANDVVMSLIVDDGVPRRGHRKSLFANEYRYAGVGCGTHPQYRVMCVVDMSGTATGEPVIPQMANR